MTPITYNYKAPSEKKERKEKTLTEDDCPMISEKNDCIAGSIMVKSEWNKEV